MTVSVILPFRNAEATLAKAIQSILDQTFQDFELILVDNASNDRSKDIAISYSDARIKLVSEPSIGVEHAANLGLSESNGALIARMDADDFCLPTRIEMQLLALHENPEIGLVSGMIEFMERPTEGFQKYLDWINQVRTPEEICANQFVEYPIVNPSVMFRRELCEKYGGYRSGDFPEDYEFFLRLMKSGVKMMKVDQCVLKWNDLPNRLTRTSDNYSESAFNRIKSKYLADWLDTHNSLHPDIWIWGAGKKSRQKSAELEKHGVRICGYIDVSNKKNSGERSVIHFEELPERPDRFIVSYVSNWGASEKVRTYLSEHGWKDGNDFILAG